jgi:hypothetical protein
MASIESSILRTESNDEERVCVEWVRAGEEELDPSSLSTFGLVLAPDGALVPSPIRWGEDETKASASTARLADKVISIVLLTFSGRAS